MRIKVNNGRIKVNANRAKYNYYDESRDVVNTIRADVSLNSYQRLYAHFSVGMEINEGIWTLNKAYYGWLGGIAATHKWNWRDLRNLDGAFRLTENSTITHSNLGVKGNSAGYFDTHLIPSMIFSNDFSFSMYCFDNPIATSTEYAMGTTDPLGGNHNNSLIIKRSGGNSIFLASGFNTAKRADVATINSSLGYWIGSYKVGSEIFIMKDAVKISLENAFLNAIKGNSSIWLLGANGQTSGFTQKGFGLTTISEGISETEAKLKSKIILFSQKMRANF